MANLSDTSITATISDAMQSESESKSNDPVSTIGKVISEGLGVIPAVAEMLGGMFDRTEVEETGPTALGVGEGEITVTPLGNKTKEFSRDQGDLHGYEPIHGKELTHLSRTPSRYKILDWKTSQEQGTIVAILPVTPQLCSSYVENGYRYYSHTNLSFASMWFNRWRGKLKFIFECVSTKFHQGKLAAVFWPTPCPGTLPYVQARSMGMQFFSASSSENSLEFKVDFTSAFSYLGLKDMSSAQDPELWLEDGLLSSSRYVSGYVVLFVANQLSAPDTVAQRVDVNCSISADEDFEFAWVGAPRTMEFPLATNTSEPTWTQISEVFHEEVDPQPVPPLRTNHMRMQPCSGGTIPGQTSMAGQAAKLHLTGAAATCIRRPVRQPRHEKSHPAKRVETETVVETDYNVATFDWKVTDPIGTTVFEYDIFKLLFVENDLPLRGVGGYHALMGGNLEVSVHTSTNPMYAGILLTTFVPPGGGYVAKFRSEGSSLPNLPHVKLEVGSVNEVCTSFPMATLFNTFKTTRSTVSSDDLVNTMGRVRVVVWNQLSTSTTGASAVTINLHMRFTNSSMSTRTRPHTPFVAPGPGGQLPVRSVNMQPCAALSTESDGGISKGTAESVHIIESASPVCDGEIQKSNSLHHVLRRPTLLKTFTLEVKDPIVSFWVTDIALGARTMALCSQFAYWNGSLHYQVNSCNAMNVPGQVYVEQTDASEGTYDLPVRYVKQDRVVTGQNCAMFPLYQHPNYRVGARQYTRQPLVQVQPAFDEGEVDKSLGLLQFVLIGGQGNEQSFKNNMTILQVPGDDFRLYFPMANPITRAKMPVPTLEKTDSELTTLGARGRKPESAPAGLRTEPMYMQPCMNYPRPTSGRWSGPIATLHRIANEAKAKLMSGQSQEDVIDSEVLDPENQPPPTRSPIGLFENAMRAVIGGGMRKQIPPRLRLGEEEIRLKDIMAGMGKVPIKYVRGAGPHVQRAAQIIGSYASSQTSKKVWVRVIQDPIKWNDPLGTMPDEWRVSVQLFCQCHPGRPRAEDAWYVFDKRYEFEDDEEIACSILAEYFTIGPRWAFMEQLALSLGYEIEMDKPGPGLPELWRMETPSDIPPLIDRIHSKWINPYAPKEQRGRRPCVHWDAKVKLKKDGIVHEQIMEMGYCHLDGPTNENVDVWDWVVCYDDFPMDVQLAYWNIVLDPPIPPKLREEKIDMEPCGATDNLQQWTTKIWKTLLSFGTSALEFMCTPAETLKRRTRNALEGAVTDATYEAIWDVVYGLFSLLVVFMYIKPKIANFLDVNCHYSLAQFSCDLLVLASSAFVGQLAGVIRKWLPQMTVLQTCGPIDVLCYFGNFVKDGFTTLFGLQSFRMPNVRNLIVTEFVKIEARNLLQGLHKVMSRVWEWLTTGPTGEESEAYKLLADQIDALQREWYAEQKEGNLDYGMIIKDATGRLEGLLKHAASTAATAMGMLSNKRDIFGWRTWCKEVLDKWSRFTKARQHGGLIPEPLGIALRGKPGVGKSILTGSFMPLCLLGALDIIERDVELPSHLYTMPTDPDHKFLDGYCGQTIVRREELGASTDGKDYLQMLSLISSVAEHVNQADIAEKGCLFVSDVVMVTTNALGITSTGITDKEAISRRFPFTYRIEVRPGYETTDGKADIRKLSQELEHVKERNEMMKILDKVWKFYPEKLSPTTSSILPAITFSEVIAILVTAYRDRRKCVAQIASGMRHINFRGPSLPAEVPTVPPPEAAPADPETSVLVTYDQMTRLSHGVEHEAYRQFRPTRLGPQTAASTRRFQSMYLNRDGLTTGGAVGGASLREEVGILDAPCPTSEDESSYDSILEPTVEALTGLSVRDMDYQPAMRKKRLDDRPAFEPELPQYGALERFLKGEIDVEKYLDVTYVLLQDRNIPDEGKKKLAEEDVELLKKELSPNDFYSAKTMLAKLKELQTQGRHDVLLAVQRYMTYRTTLFWDKSSMELSPWIWKLASWKYGPASTDWGAKQDWYLEFSPSNLTPKVMEAYHQYTAEIGAARDGGGMFWTGFKTLMRVSSNMLVGMSGITKVLLTVMSAYALAKFLKFVCTVLYGLYTSTFGGDVETCAYSRDPRHAVRKPLNTVEMKVVPTAARPWNHELPIVYLGDAPLVKAQFLDDSHIALPLHAQKALAVNPAIASLYIPWLNQSMSLDPNVYEQLRMPGTNVGTDVVVMKVDRVMGVKKIINQYATSDEMNYAMGDHFTWYNSREAPIGAVPLVLDCIGAITIPSDCPGARNYKCNAWSMVPEELCEMGDCGMYVVDRFERICGMIIGRTMPSLMVEKRNLVGPCSRNELERAIKVVDGLTAEHNHVTYEFPSRVVEVCSGIIHLENTTGEVVHQPTDTKYVRSPMAQPKLWVDGHRPANISKDAVKTQFLKYAQPTLVPTVTFEEKRFVASEYENRFHLFQDRPKEVLSEEQVMNGIDGLSPILLNTSAGTWNTKNGHGKQFYFERPNPESPIRKKDACRTYEHPVHKRSLDVCIKIKRELAEKGFRTNDDCWIECGKDEMLPAEKVIQKGCRTFEVPPLTSYWLYREYFGSFAAFMRKHGGRIFHHGIGCDKEEVWAAWLAYLRSRGDNAIACDFKRWDGSVPPWAFAVFAEVVRLYYAGAPEQDNKVRDVLIHELQYTMLLVYDKKYCVQQGNCSGNPLTDLFNTIVQTAAWMIVFLRRAKELRMQLEKDDFSRNVALLTYGDDGNVVFSDSMAKDWNPDAIQDEMTSMGFTITGTGKKDTKLRWVKPDQLDFLKSKYLRVNDVIMPCPPAETLFKMLNWIQKGNRTPGLMKAILEDVHRMASYFGKAFYDHLSDQIRRQQRNVPMLKLTPYNPYPWSHWYRTVWSKQVPVRLTRPFYSLEMEEVRRGVDYHLVEVGPYY